ncbi:hypothetical protein ACW2Q0_03865 [Nocardia sp. R16R-3T]
MNLDLVPGELPVIASRLGISAEDLLLMLQSTAPACVPVQPGSDDVSACIPAAFGPHAMSFFPKTVNGAVEGHGGAIALPEIDIEYTVNDMHFGGQVLSNGMAFDK